MINFIKKNPIPFFNAFIVLLLLLLPYYIFEGKLYLGGDDTRLFYVYPKEYLTNIPFFSWTNLSSVGWNFSYQTFLPFVTIWAVLSEIVKSKIVLGYFSFSLPFILGFGFFKKLISELIIENRDAYKMEILAGALFYIFSPIIINNHFLNPLIPIWLIGLIPAVCFFFLRFLKTGKPIYILFAVVFITIFSFGSHNIPWILGFLMPVVISGLLCSLFFKKNDVVMFVRKFTIFFAVILLSQSFWLFGFLITLIASSTNSFTAKVLSQDFIKEFANSIRATSTGSIIYPLLNLYHRQIAFDFQWNLKNIYMSFYDKTYFINSIYIVALFLGILNFKKYTSRPESKIFLFLLVAFVISLYLFTIKIGPLMDFYLLLGYIPGFVLFRNPYDKFALGYVLIYSLLITYCVIILNRKYNNISKKSLIIIAAFFLAIFVSALPTKNIIVSPLWTTKNIYKNIIIPQEYFDFMRSIKNTISPTNNIFSVPYGLSLYTVIKDADTNNVYVGVSPVVIFSGVNDISGFLSFNYAPDAKVVDKLIATRNYNALNEILYNYNINYIFLTKNIPEEVKKSFLFVQDVLRPQDKEFISNITDKKIITSSNGNYELYTAKKRNSLVSSNNLSYERISRVKYKISIKNVKRRQELLFNDTFHEGWKLYLLPSQDKFICEKQTITGNLKTIECKSRPKPFEIADLNYIWERPIFDSSHRVKNEFSNKWIIDPDYVKKNYTQDMFRLNPDGSIDLELVLYFKPQVYFYIGTAVSILTIGLLVLFTILKRK